ncbi:MAG TPA: hypothetical protein VMV00_01005 [Candidatus Baltobacteraceae bacterium]|nr:hypothetical protein [Candidatus Baltobacteraceae bacterium]
MDRSKRAQAALDFMVSYGVALLVITIAIAIVFQIGLFNPQLAPTYCDASPGFSCLNYNLNSTGALTVTFSQAIGGTLTIVGAGCATQANGITVSPAFGNVGVIPYSTGAQFYPTNALKNDIVMYSSSTSSMTMYCYGPSGKVGGQKGNSFTGFVWLNYSVSSMPTTNSIQQVAAVSAKYT